MPAEAPSKETPKSSLFSDGLAQMGEAFSKFRAENQGRFPGSAGPLPGQTPSPPPAATPPAEPAPLAADPEKPAAEPEKPEAKAREVKVGGFSTPGDDKHLKSEDFNKAKESSYRRGLEEAEKKFRETMVAKTEYETLAKERDELRTKLQQVSLEQDPEFQREFSAKVNSAVSMARSAVGAELANEVEQLLRSPDSGAKDDAMDRIIENLRPNQRARLGAAMAQYAQANADRESLLAAAPKLMANREAQAKEFNQKREEYKKQAFTNAWSTAEEELPDFLARKDGDAAHNELVDHTRKLAHYICNEASTAEVARASVQAAIYPVVIADNLKLTRQVKELQAEIGKLKEGKPNLGEGASAATTGGPLPANMDGLLARVKAETGLR